MATGWAIVEAIGSCFKSLSDPRRTRNRKHRLVDIAVGAVCGMAKRWTAALRVSVGRPEHRGEQTRSASEVVKGSIRDSGSRIPPPSLRGRMRLSAPLCTSA
jgi:hypothetical protein